MKKHIFPPLTTPRFNEVNKELPWNEYPRPSMKRDSFICLNGEWDFSISSSTSPEYKEKITVPFPPESKLSGIERRVNRGETLFYRRSVTVSEKMADKRLILHFGAVDTIAEVYVNGILTAKHAGGYLPFEVDVTDFIKDNAFELVVKVTDELNGDYPYGKQKRNRGGMWYTPVSGIWQTVWLEAVPENYIKALFIDSNLERAKIRIVGGEEKKRITLIDTEEVFDFCGDEAEISPKDPIPWSPETPHIYRIKIESGKDTVEGYFALREIGIKSYNGIERLTLNGEPYLFSGLLDQGYYPDGIFLPPTPEGYKDDILLAKSLGFNTLRKHIKVEPEIFYYLCDCLGIVVFQDMINNSGYSFFFDTALPTVGMKKFPDKLLHPSKKTRDIFIQSMKETINYLNNFPSVLYYTVFNEGWGQFCADDAYKIAKELAPSRIIDTTSGWFTQHLSDVDSRHVYFKKIKIKKPSKRPISISEFGGYSHRVEGHLFGSDNYGYSIYENREEFEKAFINLYEKDVLPLIKQGICALIYTQISDVEDETNGLITYDRKVTKLDPARSRETMKKLYDELRKMAL